MRMCVPTRDNMRLAATAGCPSRISLVPSNSLVRHAYRVVLRVPNHREECPPRTSRIAMLSTLTPSFSTHSRILFCFSRRCISQNVILFNNKPNAQLSKKKDQTPSHLVGISKTIDAKSALPDIPTQNLKYLRKLSAKHALLARVLKSPIELIEWSQLPKQKKVDSFVRLLGWGVIFAGVFIFLNGSLLYYIYREHEITNRGFFQVYQPELIKKMDQVILDETLQKYAEKFVESSSPLVKTLDRVLQMLIESNKDFVEDENFDLNWTCTMIDDCEKFDLFVMDDMKFITLTKAVAQVCQNEHQLAYLMANALAHFLLKHKREPLSNIKPYNLWTGYKLIYAPLLWSLFSSANFFNNAKFISLLDKVDRAIGSLFYGLYRKLADTMCYSNTLEEEADRIALQLLARACFDVREAEKVAVAFHKLLPKTEIERSKTREVQRHRYIYKHAYNDHKLAYFRDNLSKFVEFRQKCGCAPLK